MGFDLRVQGGISGHLVCTIHADLVWNVSTLNAAIEDAGVTLAEGHKRCLSLGGRLLQDGDILGEAFADATPVVSLVDMAVPQPMNVEFIWKGKGMDIPELVCGTYHVDPDWSTIYPQEDFGGSFRLPIEACEACTGEIKWCCWMSKPPGTAQFRFVVGGTEVTCAGLPESVGLDGNCNILDFHYLWDECLAAAETGDSEKMHQCVSSGAPLETRNHDNETPLIVAARNDNKECLSLLIDGGAELEAQDFNGNTAAMTAALNGQIDSLHLLAKKGANIDCCHRDGSTLLMLVAKKGHQMCLRFLIDHGTPLDTRNIEGNTAVMLAVIHKNAASLQLLTDAGAHVNGANNSGWTAATSAAVNGCTDCLRILIENGANLDARHPDGSTAVILAALSGQVSCLLLLVQSGCDLGAMDSAGRTAAMRAAEGRTTPVECARCLRMLAEQGSAGASELLPRAFELEAQAEKERQEAVRRQREQQELKLARVRQVQQQQEAMR
jgi:ankyrin repeat protein